MQDFDKFWKAMALRQTLHHRRRCPAAPRGPEAHTHTYLAWARRQPQAGPRASSLAHHSLATGGKRPFLVMYDISEDRTRTRLAHYLENMGLLRMQKSVFLANLGTHHRQLVLQALCATESLLLSTDSVILFPMEERQAQNALRLGHAPQWEDATRTQPTVFI
jgi:CRISPR-associated protein Cas2